MNKGVGFWGGSLKEGASISVSTRLKVTCVFEKELVVGLKDFFLLPDNSRWKGLIYLVVAFYRLQFWSRLSFKREREREEGWTS